MPLTYPEPNPADEFTVADWKEFVATEQPGPGFVFTNKSGQASLVGVVPACKLRSMRKFVVGYSRAYAGTPYKLFRTNPPKHPEFPEMRATRMTASRMMPEAAASLGPFDGKVVWRYSDDPTADIPRYAAYGTMFVTVTFDTLPYEMMADADPAWQGKEYLRNTSLFHDTTARLGVIMADSRPFLEFTESWPGGPAVGQEFGGTVGEYLPMCDLVVAWWGVHEKFILNTSIPRKLLDGIGSVNHDEWLGCPAGTLKLDVPKLDRYRLPAWADEPVILYDVFLPI